MNISSLFINAVKCTKYRTPRYFSSYRITRIPLEDKVPLNFKLINEKLLELQEIDSANRSRILETYDAISDSNVRKVLDDFYYTQLLKQTSNLCLTFIPEDYTKIFTSFRTFPKLTPECVQNLNSGVQRLSKNFTTEQIANLLRSYAHIKSRSVKTITELIETFNKKRNQTEVWELREVASALASLNIPVTGPVKEFYEYTVSTLPKYLKSMEPNDIAIFVNSFSSQGVKHNEVLHFIDMNCNSIINKIYPKGLALILNSFARNNKLSDNLMLTTSNKLMKILEDKDLEMYNRMNIIDIAMIFNSFVKLEYYDQKLFDSYIPWVLDKMNDDTPTLSIVLLVHAYAQSGIKSRDLFSKAAHYLVYRVSQFNPQKLGVVSLSFAKVGYAPPLLFHRIADEIIYRGTIGLKYSRYEFSFRALEQITQAFSRIGFKDKRLFSVLTTLLKTRFKSNSEEMTGEMVASLMVSLSRNKVDEFVPFISQILEKVNDYTAFSTVALSKVVSSFNRLGIKNAKLANKFLKETRNRVNQFPPSVLINAFKALSKLGCYDSHLIKETLKRCSLHLATLSTIDLANLAYSLSEFSYRNVSFLKKLSVCVNYQMSNFTKQQLHVLFTRLAMLRVSDMDLMSKLIDRISSVQHEFNEVELAEICLSIIYVIMHFDCLNKEMSSGVVESDSLVYNIPDRFYNVQDHLLSLLKQKLDVATIFKLKTIYIYLKNMKPEKYAVLSKKSREILEKADSVQFSLAEYLLTSSSVHKEISYYMNMIGVPHKNEVQFGPYLIDIVPELNYKVAVEYDGPSHFYAETLMRNIKSILKHEILSSCGWKVIHIPYQEWAQLDGQLVTLYLESDWKFTKLNELIKDQLNIPVTNQRLYLDGNLLGGNYDLVSDSGIKSGDVLLVKSDFGAFDYSSLLSQEVPTVSDDVLMTRTNEILEDFKPGSMGLETLKLHNPELYNAVKNRNKDEVFNLVKRDYEKQKKEEMERKQKLIKAYLDPLNPESQSLIHEEIEKNRIDENLISAQNYLPESFGKIVMLYIKVEINNVVFKALVDTGAQNTIMSKDVAERCNLLSLVDKRFKGVAVGVGTMKTLGKIHLADMKIGSIFIPVSFIVLDEPNLEFILGLDVLRRYTCDINLKNNYLGINDVKVPFLSEAELLNFNNLSSAKSSSSEQVPKASVPTTSSLASSTTVPLTQSFGSNSSQDSIEEKVKRLSEMFNLEPEHARHLLEIAGWDEELAASFVTE